MQTTVLMIEGRTLIPARRKAMTKGDDAAVPVEFERASLSYGLGRVIGWGSSKNVRRDLHNHANDQNAQNVEEEHSVEGLLRRIRDNFPWVAGLCS